MNDSLNQKRMQNFISSLDIEHLNFSVRTQGGLRKSGINLIGDLCQKTQLDLLHSKYLSRRCIEEITDRLAEIGLSLKPFSTPIVTAKDWKMQPIPEKTIKFDILL